MQRTCIDGIFMWSKWQPDRAVNFNSYFVQSDDGSLLVDPLPLDDGDAQQIVELGGAAWIVVTTRDHERAAGAAAERLGAKIARNLAGGDEVGPARVVALEGFKTPDEFALDLRRRQTVIVGDALWGDPAGSLRMMPDETLGDPKAAARSLCTLRSLHPRHVLVGDGAPVFERGYEAISSCLEARGDLDASVVNLDELVFRRDSGPGDYSSDDAEIGFRLGAERLGYRATRLHPGDIFCPTHWHTGEEELFIVWDGTPTIESPRGARLLRAGDLIAFPTRPFGAHKLINRSNAPATLILIANTNPHDVCFYPDSKKLLVEATDTLVRTEPILDYYDGEA